MILRIIVLLILVLLIGAVFARNANMSYRTGAGLFKSSDNNMDEKEEFSDKEYYDENGGLFK